MTFFGSQRYNDSLSFSIPIPPRLAGAGPLSRPHSSHSFGGHRPAPAAQPQASAQRTSAGVMGEFAVRVEVLLRARNYSISHAQAMAEVLRGPDGARLYAEYLQANPAQRKER
jgi:hypothetical protein